MTITWIRMEAVGDGEKMEVSGFADDLGVWKESSRMVPRL